MHLVNAQNCYCVFLKLRFLLILSLIWLCFVYFVVLDKLFFTRYKKLYFVAIKSLEDDLKVQKQNQDKLITEFESERLVLKNMITVTESVMEDQKNSLNNIILDNVKANEALEGEIKTLKALIDSERSNFEIVLKDKEIKAKAAFEIALKELNELRKEKEDAQKDFESQIQKLESKVLLLEKNILEKNCLIDTTKTENKDLIEKLEKHKEGNI